LRAFSENPRNDLEVIAINDLGPVQTNAHLLKYDSVHGRFGTEIEITDNSIDIGHGPIAVTAIRNPAELPWKDVDIVLECTGFFTERATAAQHLENGAARVIVSAPCKDADKTIVYGVNHGALSDQDIVISNASCTTNCLAPVAQVLNDSIGLKRGFMTTIHSYTGDQPTLDTMHKDLYRARSAALNMIPTTTGAARAVGLVMPDLLGKLDGVSIRVPTPNVSCVDLTFEASRDTTINEINAAFEAAAAEGTLKGVLGTTNEPLVSMDFNHDSRSSIVALDQTKVMEGTMCRILSWYDNEWGFSNRMLDTATQMAKFL
jgi:glyceraldehyde 3-phosphate dehydrogenase